MSKLASYYRNASTAFCPVAARGRTHWQSQMRWPFIELTFIIHMSLPSQLISNHIVGRYIVRFEGQREN